MTPGRSHRRLLDLNERRSQVERITQGADPVKVVRISILRGFPLDFQWILVARGRKTCSVRFLTVLGLQRTVLNVPGCFENL